MKFSLSFILLLLVLNEAKELRQEYSQWKNKYGKGKESNLRADIQRYKIFQKSADQIDLINSVQDSWGADFTIFADKTDEERKMMFGLLNGTDPEIGSPPPSTRAATGALPVQKHWEMTDVKFQGSCGSCWAFAAAAFLEGHHMKEHGEWREFSEQTLLSCTKRYSNSGCDGGFTTGAVDWAGKKNTVSKSDNHGYLPMRSDNKYVGKDLDCTEDTKPFANALKRAKPASYHSRPRFEHMRSDKDLLYNLYETGPVGVYIYASTQFQFYQVGLYQGMGCHGSSKTPSNHAVVASGYGVDYFLVKNSWGSLWGRSGYAYFDRSQKSLCNIAQDQILVDWRPNTAWDVCKDTHPSERTSCGFHTEITCGIAGCCYDAAAEKDQRCFAKGKITVWDEEGNRRVFYGSAPDFSDYNFASKAVAAQVEFGSWHVYEKDDFSTWFGDYRLLLSSHGKINMEIQSVKIH